MAMESNRNAQINRTSMRMRGSVFLYPISLQNKLSIK